MFQSGSITAEEILHDAKIEGISPGFRGRQYAICPGCSHERTGSNRKSKCLAVNIDHKGVRWHCNHCDSFKGGRFFEPQRRDGQYQGAPGSISQRAMPRQQPSGYASLHRAARSNWR